MGERLRGRPTDLVCLWFHHHASISRQSQSRPVGRATKGCGKPGLAESAVTHWREAPSRSAISFMPTSSTERRDIMSAIIVQYLTW